MRSASWMSGLAIALSLTLLSAFAPASAAEPREPMDPRLRKALRGLKPAQVLDPAGVAVYDRREGTLHRFAGPEFSVATPAGGGQSAGGSAPIWWQCDTNTQCCISTEAQGCLGFLLACTSTGLHVAEIINGGQGGTCTFPYDDR